jgi:pimeloyl-ACP methyl ester carboxylesterase
VLRFVAGPYELESLDAWVEHTCTYYPWRSPERIRARLEVSLTRTPEGRWAKQYDERFREADFGGVEQGANDLWELAAAIRCPTLLLHGGDSPVLTREMAESFAERVSRVRLVTIPGAGHSVAGDAPEAFVKEVGTFLDEVLVD